MDSETNLFDVGKIWINPLGCKGNYSATSNNMKLVAVDGWAVTFGTAGHWAGWQPAQAPPRCTKRIAHQRPVYQLPYCCIMVRCSAGLMCPYKGLTAVQRSLRIAIHSAVRLAMGVSIY